MRKGILAGIGLGAAVAMQMTALAQEAAMPPLRPDQVTFLALYKELVETNTTLSAGSCTLAAERLATHLKSAGNGSHGLNERRSVRSVFVGRDFLTDLVKVYADSNN
jgi:hypothetical protein